MSPIEAALAPLPEGAAIRAAIARFEAAFAAMDVPGLLACFAPGAIFLGTGMAGPSDDAGAIGAYFAASAGRDMPRRLVFEEALAMDLGQGVVLLSGRQRYERRAAEGPRATPARFTLLLRRQAEGWRIAHFHSSARPG